MIKFITLGGSTAQWLVYLLPYPAAPGSIPKKFREERIINVVEVNQQR